MPTDAVLDSLGSGLTGLSHSQASALKSEHGDNIIQREKRESPLQLFWRQINHPIIYVLLLSTAIAIALGKVLDGFVVLGAVVLNTIVGFLQESRAGKAIEALMSLVPEESSVVREGSRHRLLSKDLVPGDVIFIQSGDKVPADARILECRSLKIEEAALTGESVPADKQTEAVSQGAAVADRRCMVYGGTLVRHGTAMAVVTSIGSDTELGRISSMLRETTQVETPLTQALNRMGKSLTWIILAIGIALLLIALGRGYPAADATLAAVTLAVSAIPEGLPTIITIALAVGVRRMARRNAIIRKLPAVETLGSTTIICTDKTGTLTRNEMMVREAWCPDSAARLDGEGYSPEGRISVTAGNRDAKLTDSLRELLLSGRLCNDTSLKQKEGKWIVDGDPTEAALITAAERAGLQEGESTHLFRRVDSIPFESERQFMATLHDAPEGGRVLYVKGAPEVVLKRCSQVFAGSGTGSAPPPSEAVHAQIDRMAARGMRVLAFARKPMERSFDHVTLESLAGLEFLGIQGMIDPPRTEALSAVRDCHAAGITVKMITGDHKGTARSIARELGMLSPAGVLTGNELSQLSDESFAQRSKDTNVFARVAPEHKLRLVRALQAQGDVVAMTGDGVNDAPALKQADIGIAMGITGTSVSKEAAKMVLTDDNFATIAAAVEEGRRIFDNLVKSLLFILPTNLGMALILMLSVLFFPIVSGHPLLPILPVQSLWINLVTGVTLAFPLAIESLEQDAMRRPPRSKRSPLLGRANLRRMVSVAILMTAGGIGLFLYEYYVEIKHHLPEDIALHEAQTMTVTAITLFQIFYLLTCRSFRKPFWRMALAKSRVLWLGIGATLLLQLAFIYLKPMNVVFGSSPLNLDAWIKSVIVALLVIPLVEVEKTWLRRRDARS